MKMTYFLSAVLLFLSTSLASALYFIDKGEVTAVNGGGGRWTFPSHCTARCRTVEWSPVRRREDEMLMKFTITGPNLGYVAIALSADETMGNDDAYICSRQTAASHNIVINSAHLVGFTYPNIDYSITSREGSGSNLTDDKLTCTFLRPLNVSKVISGLQVSWDIASTSYYLLYAEGHVNYDGSYSIHTQRTSTPDPINMAAVARRTEVHHPGFEELIDGNLSVPVNSKDNILALTNHDGGTWVVPNRKCPFGACKLIQWKKVHPPGQEPMLQFTLIGSNAGWIAMGISLDQEMGNDDCYYCARESLGSSSLQVVSAYLGGQARPIPVERLHHSKIYLAAIENSIMVCRFLRPINVTKVINGRPVTWDLSRSRFNLFFAEGPVGRRRGEIRRHSLRKHTHGPIYLLSSKGYKLKNPLLEELNGTVDSSLPDIFHNHFPESNIERHPDGGGRWSFPSGCRSSCRFLVWEPLIRNEQIDVKITISGVGKDYVGFLIATGLTATAGDCYFCVRNPANESEVEIKSGNCSPQVPPHDLKKIPLEQIAKTQATENALTCTFYRPLSVRKSYNQDTLFYNLSDSAYVLIYEEGMINQKRISPPVFSAFTPVPFTLVNSTLIKTGKGKATTRDCDWKKAFSPNFGAIPCRSGRSWSGSYQFFLVISLCSFSQFIVRLFGR